MTPPAEQYSEAWFVEHAELHPRAVDCDDPECLVCGWRDCKHNEPLHYHHDGCPSCDCGVCEHCGAIVSQDDSFRIVNGDLLHDACVDDWKALS